MFFYIWSVERKGNQLIFWYVQRTSYYRSKVIGDENFFNQILVQRQRRSLFYTFSLYSKTVFFIEIYFNNLMNDYGMKFVLRSMLFPLNHKCNFFTFEFGKEQAIVPFRMMKSLSDFHEKLYKKNYSLSKGNNRRLNLFYVFWAISHDLVRSR